MNVAAGSAEYQDAIVRTVLGDVLATDLGHVSAHDHVGVFGGLGPVREPDFRLDEVDWIVEDVRAFRDSGGGAIVDANPLVEGRSAATLVAIAKRTGVHIIAATHDGHAAVRGMAQRMAIEHAVGLSTALADTSHGNVRAVSRALLRERLRLDGAVVDMRESRSAA